MISGVSGVVAAGAGAGVSAGGWEAIVRAVSEGTESLADSVSIGSEILLGAKRTGDFFFLSLSVVLSQRFGRFAER